MFGDGSQTRSFCYVDDLIRGFVLLAESDVHLPVNLGNPKEMTLLELAEAVIEATESRSEIVFEALPVDDPQVRQPDITRARQLLGWEPEVELPRGTAAHDRAGGRRAARRRHRLSAGPRVTDRPPADRPSDGDLPAVSGRRGEHLLPLRHRPGRARPRRRGLHGPGGGRAAGPRQGRRPPDQAQLRDRQRAADPEPGPDRGLRRRSPPLSVHLRLRADAARAAGAKAQAPGAAGPLQEPADRQGHPRGRLFEAYEHTAAPLLVREADRVCVLSADHANSVPYLRRTAERRPEKLVEMPNGVDTTLFSPGPNGSGLRDQLGIADDALVAAFVATLDRAHHFKRLDLAIEALARIAAGGAGAAAERSPEVHLVVAGGGELLEAFRDQATNAGVGERVHFLGSVPHARAARRASRRRPPPAHHRAAGVVRDSPDRGDGLRAAGDRDGVPGCESGRRRRGNRVRRPQGRRRSRHRGGPEAGRPRAPPVAPRWERPDERSASGCGAGHACSTAWTGPMRRRSQLAGRRPVEPAPGRLLLSPLPRHRRPPARGDGQVAATAGPSGHGADDLRVRDRRRRHRGGHRAHARPTAPARAPARPRSGGRPVRLRHLLGPAARPQQGDRAGAAGRRLGAVRPLGERCG